MISAYLHRQKNAHKAHCHWQQTHDPVHRFISLAVVSFIIPEAVQKCNKRALIFRHKHSSPAYAGFPSAVEPLFMPLLGDTVMSHNVRSLFQNVLFVSSLPRIVMMDHIGHTVPVPPVRNDADMLFKDHDVTALPLLHI